METAIDPTEAQELEAFGALLEKAFALAEAEFASAEANLTLPYRSPAHIAKFNAEVRRRIAARLAAPAPLDHPENPPPR